MTDIRELLARQHTLEDESRALGADRYRRQRPLPWRTDSAKVSEESSLPPGQQMLKLSIEPTADGFERFVENIRKGGAGRRPRAFTVLSQMSPREAAYLTARIIVNSAAIQHTVQATALAIADAIIDHIEMAKLRGSNKQGFKGLMRAQAQSGYSSKKRRAVRDIMDKEGVKLEVPTAERLQVGLKCIEVFCAETGFFHLVTRKALGGDQSVIQPTEAAMKWFEVQHARCEILEPILMPMVVRPKRWRTPYTGGYLSKRPGQRLVKQRNPDYNEVVKAADMSRVYAAVNAVQDTPWCINRAVLAVMREVWDGGGSLGGLPNRGDDPLPNRPEDFDTNDEAAKKWKAEAALVHRQNAETLSARLSISQRLWIAEKFAEEEAIYFPHELDFRGRIYPIPTSGPHPQGDDAAKALLRFADGVALGEQGVGWLAVHIANLFGVDKVAFDDRIDWVFQNQEAILDSARDPLDGQRFWASADSPYCALAACMEWAGYVEQGADFVSHLPVALDGSNSGLQHFSAMLRDPVGARAVNLLPAEKPQDVYSEVANRAEAIIEACINADDVRWGGTDDEGKPRLTLDDARVWVGKVSRKIAKRPCMTYCYSATRFGMQDMVLQTLREIDRDNAASGKLPHLEGHDNYKAAMLLSHVLWEAISETVSAASSAMTWLRDVAKVAASAGLPITWTTPMGLPVLQGYLESEGKPVEVYFGGKRVRLSLATDRKEINKRAQANGIAPNFVHSLDAAHLMATVSAMNEAGVAHMAVIHDSFGTHAANAAFLSETLKETFIAQYEPDLLARFHAELQDQLPPELADELPAPPPLGDLDLQLIRDSAYIFA